MGTSSAFKRSSHPRADQASLQWDLPWDRHGKLPGLFPELAVTRPRGNALCWVVTCCEEGAVLRSQHLSHPGAGRAGILHCGAEMEV